MSVSIRYRHNNANVLMNTEKVITGNAVTSNTIPALLRGGSYCFKPFGGVIDEDSMMRTAQAVKLVNVTGFWWNDMGMGPDGYDIPLGHAVKGYFQNGRYYIAIRNDQPIHWPITRQQQNYRPDNVYPLRRSG